MRRKTENVTQKSDGIGDIDVLIAGAGPAGLTAAIYSSRSGLATVIYEKGHPGGLANLTEKIENYPGFPEGISGLDLGHKMHEQATRFGAKLVTSPVERLWRDHGLIKASSHGRTISARCAIVATGSTPKNIGVPGELEFTGKGVSYCAACDGPLYRDKSVAVIGGGDSALQEAIFLARFARSVVVIHRRDRLRAASVLEEEVRRNPRIVLALNKTAESIEGGSEVKGVLVEDRTSGAQEMIAADGVFIYVGYSASVEMLGAEFKKSESGFLLTDWKLETSVEGVFAAGDVREKTLRQVSTAVGDGALAAMSVYSCLEGLDKHA